VLVQAGAPSSPVFAPVTFRHPGTMQGMIFALPLDQVNADRLEALKADGTREGRHLEYKETLPGTSDDERKEFLADATSFANAAGGDLIYGVRGRRDTTGKPTGEIEEIVGLPGLNLDAEQLRLENMLRDGVAPRMSPLTFHLIPRTPAPPCLLVRIPRGWAGLHMIIYKNWSRFYSRNSGGKYQLDVNEIRAALLAAETAYDRLRRLRVERVARALALETPVSTGEGPKLMLHALPINASEEVWPRVRSMQESEIGTRLPIIAGTVSTWRYNLDGFVAHTQRDNKSRQCYTQLFRDGGIEALSGGVLAKHEERGGFYPWGMEQMVIGGLGQYQQFAETVGVAPPLLISLTLSGVKGWRVLRGPYDFNDGDAVFDRDVVSPPEVMVSDLAAPADIVLRPVFDFIWNGGGWPGSPNYRDGRWVKPPS
jgi:hypothetical protein